MALTAGFLPLPSYAQFFDLPDRRSPLFIRCGAGRRSLIKCSGISRSETRQISSFELAEREFNKGNYADALDAFEQALTQYESEGDRTGMADALNGMGLSYVSLGNYPEALEQFDQALTIFEDTEDLEGQANVLNSLGSIYSSLGQPERSLSYLQDALSLRETVGATAAMGDSLHDIGFAYYSLGNYSEAIDYYQNALDIAVEVEDLAGESRTLNALAYVHYLLGNDDEAVQLSQRALPLAQHLQDKTAEGLILNTLGHIYARQGDDALALPAYQQAIVLAQIAESPNLERIYLSDLGFFLDYLGQTELAIVFLKQSVNITEQIRESNQTLPADLQSSYTATAEQTYRHLASLLLQQDRILEAQRVLDLLKVQELDGYLRGMRSSDTTLSGTELTPAERAIANVHQDLLDRAIANGRRLSELEIQDTLTDAELDELSTLQAERREILQAFNTFKDSDLVQAQLNQLTPSERSRNVQLNQLVGLQDNLAQIPQGAVLLYPLILEDSLELVVTSPYAPPIRHTVEVSRVELNEAVQAFRYALEEPTRDAITPAQTLYNWLISPIEADLEAAGVNTIIYAPDRTLRYIPLAALHDGTQWLTQRYRINHITATSLTDLNAAPRSTPSILAGALTEGPITVDVGDRSYRFSLLNYADDEINTISNLAPNSTPLLDTDFNRTRIERDANRHTILHLATHAKFLVGQPEDSFILFSDQERWTLADFKAGLLNLSQVDLVVLSACETGVDNTFGNGEEILGFGYLMQEAGARAAMASLWAVDDGGTQVLMTEFYDGLIRGNLSKAEALRQAQLALIRIGEEGDRGGFEIAAAIELEPNDLSHPHYWAPFILIGNGL
jgi:CHAT domain-containing protein/tetratricopeptide (TPR) repeat protein